MVMRPPSPGADMSGGGAPLMMPALVTAMGETAVGRRGAKMMGAPAGEGVAARTGSCRG